jgi:hypothetical protein
MHLSNLLIKATIIVAHKTKRRLSRKQDNLFQFNVDILKYGNLNYSKIQLYYLIY